MNFNLIVPVAIDRPEYQDECPYLLAETKTGKIPVLEGIQGLDLELFSAIYLVLLKKHDELYGISEKLNRHIATLPYGNKFHSVLLEHSTLSETESVYETIKKEKISGSLLVKDADNFFICDCIQGNGVAIYPLDALTRVNPQHKSYVTLDDFFNITNIIEKKIIGRHFCTGGYFFETASDFLYYFEKLQKYHPFYMLFMIFAMLLDGVTFRPVFVEEYQDWGTREDWQYAVREATIPTAAGLL